MTFAARLFARLVSAGAVRATDEAERAARAAREAQGLGAVWFLDAAGALRQAEAVDRAVLNGRPIGCLAGVPILVKDSFAVSGMPGGAGGPVRTDARDAWSVAQCRRLGALILGKTAMDQLGWTMTGQCRGRPPCQNPIMAGHQPGGSSSGSAVAVAAGIVRIALGADTGGSVRVPASWCGVVGFKPERSAVSRDGMAPVADSFDAVGYLSGSVDDCRLAHEALSPGSDIGAGTLPPTRGLRLAVDPSLLDGVDKEVASAFARGLAALESAGVVIAPEPLPSYRVPIGALYSAQFASAWGDLVDAAPDIFGENVRLGVAAGRRVDPGALRDGLKARYLRSQAGTLGADAFACPATPVLPRTLSAPDDVATVGRFCRPFNVLDWPAISVPCPDTPVPVGFQIAAPRGRTAILFRLAEAIENAG